MARGQQSVMSCSDIALSLPSDGGVQEVPLQVPAHGAVMLMINVWHWVYTLQSVKLIASCKNYVLIFLYLYLVMVVYKRFPYKSLY
jgi:hypothetical protein